MAKLWQADSLEDELREEERLANAMRRRRRRRWLIPLLLILLAVCVLFFVLYLVSDPPAPEVIPETTKPDENTVTILALLRLGPADALLIGTIRVVLTSILFGNFVMMVYSLAGSCFSILVMSLCCRSKRFGIIGISIAGAVSHNLGQCLAAALLMQNQNIMWYLPLLILYGVIAGLVTGIISSEILKRI